VYLFENALHYDRFSTTAVVTHLKQVTEAYSVYSLTAILHPI